MKITISLLFAFLMIVSCSQSKAFEKGTNKKKVFLFAGQSNMDGRGNGAELTEVDLERLAQVADRIHFYYNHQFVTPLQLSTPGKAVQNKFNLSQCFGPELFFGIELAERFPEDTLIFIKRSVGGTSLHGCWNPDWSLEKATLMGEQDKPKLYEDLMDYTQSILSRYRTEEYQIKGMLWVQGEADSNVWNYGETAAESYEQNLKNLIRSSRIRLVTPQMPFMMFQVGGGKVVEGMINTAASDEFVYLIPQSKDKGSLDYYEQYDPPRYHYNTESMKRIGVEFFKAYLKMLD